MTDGADFDRDGLLDAFDTLGAAARANGVVLDLAVYGGSALMLASNFRFATEDVDIAEIGDGRGGRGGGWPDWLSATVAAVAGDRDWSEDWLSEAVQFHLSPRADRAADHVEFGTFPRLGEPGLRIYVPTLEYMLALKIKAMRVNDPAKGEMETGDIRNLLLAGGVETPDQAMAIVGKFFPRTAREPDAHMFLLRYLWPGKDDVDGAPRYPVLGR